jgi:tRNA (guanine-N7-)-methyltransferase
MVDHTKEMIQEGGDDGEKSNTAASDNNRNNKRKKIPEGETETKTETTRTSITNEGDMPQKKFYRQRAHCNPLSHNDAFEYPLRHDLMDWTTEHYPAWKESSEACRPTVLDIGCGFGGLTVALSKALPDETILGMEIRAKVTEFVRLRILALRKDVPGSYQNASVMRTNSMKFLPNYFPKGSLEKLFFCFPDPHFKRKNHPRRIVSERLLSEYAYLLKPKIGRLYCITDVKDLHDWHVAKCDAHPLFRRLSDEVADADPCVAAMKIETEEGKKVARAKGEKYYAVYERIENAEGLKVRANNFFASS